MEKKANESSETERRRKLTIHEVHQTIRKIDEDMERFFEIYGSELSAKDNKQTDLRDK